MANYQYNMPFCDYAVFESIHASSLKAGRTSMKHMRHAMTRGHKETTPAMQFGKLAHAAILEPLTLMRDCVAWDKGAKRGSEWTQFKAANEGKEIVSSSELSRLLLLVASVNSNAEARDLLSDSKHEVSCFWDDPVYGAAKARLDGVCAAGVVEVKTCNNIEERSIGNQFVSLGYDLQVGWYQHAADVCGLCKRKTVYMVYVESNEPFDCVVFTVPVRAITKGYQTACELASRYRECEAANDYPGTQDIGVRDLAMPAYYEGDVELDDVMPM